jgi:hypothetical protein
VALEGVNPLNPILTDCADPPEFVKTTTIEPSVFLNAPIATLDTDPVVCTRYAPGRMKRDHIANAHSRPEGETVEATFTR